MYFFCVDNFFRYDAYEFGTADAPHIQIGAIQA